MTCMVSSALSDKPDCWRKCCQISRRKYPAGWIYFDGERCGKSS